MATTTVTPRRIYLQARFTQRSIFVRKAKRRTVSPLAALIIVGCRLARQRWQSSGSKSASASQALLGLIRFSEPSVPEDMGAEVLSLHHHGRHRGESCWNRVMVALAQALTANTPVPVSVAARSTASKISEALLGPLSTYPSYLL